MNRDAHSGQAAGGGEARGPRADHQRLATDADVDVHRVLPVLKARQFHVELVGGFSRGAGGVLPVDPGAALAQVRTADFPHVDTLFRETEAHRFHPAVG